jgi:hypothetical protein
MRLILNRQDAEDAKNASNFDLLAFLASWR